MQLFCCKAGSWLEDHRSTDDFPQPFIRQSKYSRFQYCRVRIDCRLNLQTTDILPPSNNNFLDPIDYIDVSVIIHISDVAGMEPAINKRLCCGFGLIPVTQYVRGRLHAQL